MKTNDFLTSWNFNLTETATINGSKEIVFNAVYSEKPRPNFLPHLDNVKIVYEDDSVQEFFFDVTRNDGSTGRVRTISRCHGDIIEFFQPEPPYFLDGYFVRWVFHETNDDSCNLAVENYWNLSPKAYNAFPENEDGNTEMRVQKHLSLYSKKALEYWSQKFMNESKP